MAKAIRADETALQHRQPSVTRRPWQDVAHRGDHSRSFAKTGGATYTSYANIDKAPERERGITIRTAHVGV